MRNIKSINKDFKTIIDVQKSSWKMTNLAIPGILLIDDGGKYHFMNLSHPLNEFSNDINYIIQHLLIPTLVESGPTFITDYFICVPMKTMSYDKNGNIRPAKKTEIDTFKFVIVYGNEEIEETRDYWIPSFIEDRGSRKRTKERHSITKPLDKFLIPDPGIFRSDLLETMCTGDMLAESEQNVYPGRFELY